MIDRGNTAHAPTHRYWALTCNSADGVHASDGTSVIDLATADAVTRWLAGLADAHLVTTDTAGVFWHLHAVLDGARGGAARDFVNPS